MKAANRRDLDFKLVISSIDTFMTHGEWDKAALNVVSLWKMAKDHGGEWKEVKALVIKYVKDWVATTDVKPAIYEKFFAVLLLQGIDVTKTFGVKKSPSPRKSAKSKVKSDDVIDLPEGDFIMPPAFDPTAEFYPSDNQPPQTDPNTPHD